MTHNQIIQPRFGYAMQPNGEARLTWPGPASVKTLRAEVLEPNGLTVRPIEMEHNGDTWIASGEKNTVLPGSAYRFWSPEWNEAQWETIKGHALFPYTAHKSPQPIELRRNDRIWTLPDNFPPDADGLRIPLGGPPLQLEQADNATQTVNATRLPIVDGDQLRYALPARSTNGSTTLRMAPALEMLETVDKGDKGRFNRVAENAALAPRKNAVIADIYLDSLVDKARLAQLKAENNGQIPVRDHFNLFGRPEGNEKGLLEIMQTLHQSGFNGLLFKPFIGGDNLSSHRYWTTDPFVLNSSFSDKKAFRHSLQESLRYGMKLYADGAFVNQGLNGVQMLSNIAYGQSSPYWNWFKYGDDHEMISLQRSGTVNPWNYPPQAYENRKYTLGILPTMQNPKTGHRDLNFDRFDVRIENDPGQKDYDNRKPTYMALYDPLIEDRQGHPKPWNNRRSLDMRGSESSVQKYRFPVSPDEMRQKNRQLVNASPRERKTLLMEWKNFRLAKPNHDDSSVKWDGHINVALMNTNHKDVQNYLKNAVGYWSRVVINSHVGTVAEALNQVGLRNPSGQTPETLRNALNSVTQRKDHPSDLKAGNRVLPTITHPALETLDNHALQKVIDQSWSGNIPAGEEGEQLAKRILTEVPVSVLNLPELFKGTLSYPQLTKTLTAPAIEHAQYYKTLRHLIEPFLKTEFLGIDKVARTVDQVLTAIRDMLFPPSFQTRLGTKLDQSYQSLRRSQQEKLQHGRLQSLIADRIGEGIYLHLLTGLKLDDLIAGKVSPQEIENGFYRTVPSDIINSDPPSAAKKLDHFMRKRLNKMQTSTLTHVLEDALVDKKTGQAITPLQVNLADAIIQKREFGLNWRIDAAKDVADMDRVRNQLAENRPAVFEEEMQSAKTFWKELGGAMRQPFPKSALIAELTDFDLLSNPGVGKKVLHNMLSSNTFNGTPNMSYMYSQLMELINYAHRPDENGGNQLKPSDFLSNSVLPMSQSVPFTALQQYQNMVSSHDFSTASHSLLTNPNLATMDLLKYWGLSDDFKVVTQELLDKPCFQYQKDEIRQQLPSLRLDATVDRLRTMVQNNALDLCKRMRSAQHQGKGYAAVADFYSQGSKEQNPESTLMATPAELKGRFIDALFDVMTPAERIRVGVSRLDPQQENVLKNFLKERMQEPSENRAMRGVVANTMERLDRGVKATATHDDPAGSSTPTFWESQQKELGLSEADVRTLRPQIQQSLWKALNQTSQEWGRSFGYQPLDVSLQEVFKRMDSNWQKGVPALQDAQKASALKESLKSGLYQEANRPVLQKMLRLFAVQNALPGNPSVYLPDWFAQGGGEWTQNIFAQNRALIRTDKLVNDPEYQAFARQAGAISRTRSNGPSFTLKTNEGQPKTIEMGPGALNDGKMLPIPADDDNGVLPIVRDNGSEQVITLVYTGKPQALDYHDKAGIGANYPEVQSDLGTLKDYRTRLRSNSLIPGRVYRDAINGERFRLEADGELKNLTHPNKTGIDIRNCRILVREPLT